MLRFKKACELSGMHSGRGMRQSCPLTSAQFTAEAEEGDPESQPQPGMELEK